MALGLLTPLWSRSKEGVVIRRLAMAFLVATPLVVVGALPVRAGQISVSWNPVAGATGYHVFYGLSSGVYGQPISTTTNSAVITGLQDCKNYFVAVKAFNSAGESPNFSNEVSGWSRPVVSSVTPAAATQGEQIVMDITGSNFQNGATVDLGDPHVNLSSVTVLSCTHVQLLATVEPTAHAVRPAQVGKVGVTVSNPDNVFGMKPQGFEILINPYRFDVNRSDAVTTDRLDGKDVIYNRHDAAYPFHSEGLCRAGTPNAGVGCVPLTEAAEHRCGSSSVTADCSYNPNYDPDKDFDGNGWVDGNDLAYIVSGNLLGCWSASTKTWTISACPTSLQ